MGTFAYQSMKKELFFDFSLVKGAPASPARLAEDSAKRVGRFDFFIASPSKALFDLLYFRTHQFRGVRFKDINTLIEEMRIDIEEMNKKDRASFYTMIKKYLYHE